MKKVLGVTALVMVATSISGCGWVFGDKGIFRDRGDDYRQASMDKPLEVPAGLNHDAIEDQLVVPRARGEIALEGEFEVPRPEPVNPSAEAEQVKLQKLGDQNWILVEAAPGEVWPRVRQFLTTNQFTVLRADATGGVIETGWLNPATGSGRERYRFRIEQGVQRGSSEVYVLQADNSAGESNWPATSSNAQRESEMLKAVAQFIADNGGGGAVSMLAQKGIDAQGKIFLERQAGQPQHLRLGLPFNRAWASLEIALPKAGFAVEDTQRDERYLLVRYDPVADKDAEKKGFFSSAWDWIFGDDSKADVLNDRKMVYRVSMQNGADINSALIMIAREDGKDLAPAAREKLLVLIKGHLI